MRPRAAFLFGRRFWCASHGSGVPAWPYLGRHTSYAGVDRETLVSLTMFEATVRAWLAVNCYLGYLWLLVGLTVVGDWLAPGGLRSAGSNLFGAAAFCCWLREARLRSRCCSLMGGVTSLGAAAAAQFEALFFGCPVLHSLWCGVLP